MTKSALEEAVKSLQNQLTLIDNSREEKFVCAVRGNYRGRRSYGVERQRKLICYECGGEGHRMRECPNKRQVKRQIQYTIVKNGDIFQEIVMNLRLEKV